MAKIVNRTMTVSEEAVLSYIYNTDNGSASALYFREADSGVQPSLINYGQMLFHDVRNTASNVLIRFATDSMWDTAVIKNYGLISVKCPLGDGKAFFAPSWGPDLINAGTITVNAKYATSYTNWGGFLGVTVRNTSAGLIKTVGDDSAIGVYLPNGGSVYNDGKISSLADGLPEDLVNSICISFPNGSGTVHNKGSLVAQDSDPNTDYASGIIFWGDDMGPIINDGFIKSDYAIKEVDTSSTDPGHFSDIKVVNRGIIEGRIYLGRGQDVLVNSGRISGYIELGTGDDLYDGRTGRLIGSLSGGDGNDRIMSGALADVLLGDAGDDALNGGAGADTMEGDLGNDRYIVDSVRDAVVELEGAGSDRIESSVSFTLGAHVEDLTLTGTTARYATGNELANRLTGNAGANILNGGRGNDTLRGGAGDDTYLVDSSGDLVVETAAGGSDLVKSSVDFVLGNQVEDLVLRGIASRGTGNGQANEITGNSRANVIRGEGGVDVLDGGLGSDRLYGGTGSDSLTGGGGYDRFHFDAALNRFSNVDEILDFSAADDSLCLDRSVFTAIAADGKLRADAFHVGASAADAEDRIVYNSATGQIFYDSDGTGAAKAILFAQMDAGTVLTNADIIAYLPEI